MIKSEIEKRIAKRRFRRNFFNNAGKVMVLIGTGFAGSAITLALYVDDAPIIPAIIAYICIVESCLLFLLSAYYDK